MDDFIKMFINAAHQSAQKALKLSGYVEEDGILLSPQTISLVAEIEEANRQHLIDQSLLTGNKELFMQLTKERNL